MLGVGVPLSGPPPGTDCPVNRLVNCFVPVHMVSDEKHVGVDVPAGGCPGWSAILAPLRPDRGFPRQVFVPLLFEE